MAQIKWIQSLAGKPASSGVMFFNDAEEILIVKPNYRNGWQLPGGVLEKNESPIEGGIREVKEEIGLTIKSLKLLSVMYATKFSEEGERYDGIHFDFDGGVITQEQISEIKLQTKELDEYRFVTYQEALTLLHVGSKVRFQYAMQARKDKTVSYVEYRQEE
jgi:8-oxo-dGTP diphosphatase